MELNKEGVGGKGEACESPAATESEKQRREGRCDETETQVCCGRI